MLSHLIGILFNPSEEWKKIRDVECTIGKCYCGYVFIMAAIAPVSGYFGTTMFGWEIGARDAIKLSPDSALMIAGLPALAYTVKLLYTGLPIMMEIDENRGFLFSSSVLAVGMVSLIVMMVAMAILWFNGFAPQFVD